MRQDAEALHQLAKTAIDGPAAKENLTRAASIIHRATGAAEAMVVYAEDRDFLVCADGGDGASTEFTQIALSMVQRQINEIGGPMAFNLIGHRVEDFASALGDDDRDFLAWAVPTSQSPSEMCILRGPWKHKGRAAILRFMESAMPALTATLERFLNADRTRHQGEQLHALADAAQVLSQSENIETALTNLATAIAAPTGVDFVNIDLWDANTERFVLRIVSESRFTSRSLAQAWRNSLNPEQPEASKLEIMRTGQPALAPDVQNDERVEPHVRQFFKLSLIRSVAIFPILFQDEFLGTMGFVSFKPRTFPPQEVSLLQGFVTQAATAIRAMQLHRALRDSAEEYRDLYENAPTAYFSVGVDGRVRECNIRAQELLGYPREELVGKAVFDLYADTPEGKEKARRVLQRFRQGEATADQELQMRRADGSLAWISLSMTPMRNDAGEIVAGRSVAVDITKRKRAEEALRDSEERFRSLGDSAPIGIFLTDVQGRCTYANPRLQAIAGLTLEDSLGFDWNKVLHPDDRQAMLEAASEAARQCGELSYEVRILTREGESRRAHIHTSPMFSAQGKQMGRVGTLEDITERKRAEEELRESRQMLEDVTQGITESILLLSTDFRILWANTAAIEQTGHQMENLLGESCYEVTHLRESPCEPPHDPCPIYQLQKTGKPTTLTHTHFDAEGKRISVEVAAYPIKNQDGEVVKFVHVSRDITDRKRAEEERERLHAELEVRAITDSLTGLYNHAHFYERLAAEIERSKRYNHGFAVIMMDVDDFKRFNDSRGHQAGDEMLRLVAGCIRSALRRSDHAFRYGGDEFAAILPHADSSKARAVVKRINRHITESNEQTYGGAAASLSLSAGVSCFPSDGTTADALVRVADAALYSAKWVARARDIMGQREDIQSFVSGLVGRRAGADALESEAALRPEALHEERARIVSSVASSITMALIDAGVSHALRDPDVQVLALVGAAAEIKDRHIRGHPERTSEQAVFLAEQMGLSPERARDIRIGGLLHDIGKVTVSEGILNKPDKLTEREFSLIKDHPVVGATLVSQHKGFERILPIIRHHHERFDGKGYPDGLAGEGIPLEARILSVVDVFDAMTHERAYRKGLSRDEAIADLERGAGTQFDPAVVEAFVALLSRRGEDLAGAAQPARKGRQLAAARAPGRGKG